MAYFFSTSLSLFFMMNSNVSYLSSPYFQLVPLSLQFTFPPLWCCHCFVQFIRLVSTSGFVSLNSFFFFFFLHFGLTNSAINARCIAKLFLGKKSVICVIVLWIVYYAIFRDVEVSFINVFLQLTLFLQIPHTRNMQLLHEFKGIVDS